MTEKQNSPDAPDCGRLLKRTREELGLTPEDVAEELRLAESQIRALEEDDWNSLPGTTYARGYLRSYARLLGLDADQLLAGATTEEIQLTRTSPTLGSVGADDDTREQEPVKSENGSGSKWGWIAAAVLAAALAVLGWQFGQGVPAPSTDSGDSASQSESGSSAAGQDVAATAGEDSREPASDTGTASSEPPMPSGPGRLVFQFNEDSWIDVRDADDNRLLYRGFKAGRRIQVDGRPPFRIFVGNARGVQVEYSGETITPETTANRMYARFTLGDAAG